jgi:CheY-like chemotaxis protein
VAITLLAVDDSVTMRKVLEITFAGQDFRVVTANSSDAALQKLKSDKPDLVIADGTLEPKNGYDLCKEIKRLSPSTPVIFLSSKQNPFDATKGAGAQVDDHMDKPFDTQQMIDKVKKLLTNQPATKGAAPTVVSNVSGTAQTTPSMPAATAIAAAGQAGPAAAAGRPGAVTSQGGITAPSAAAASAGPGPTPIQRAKTLIYNPPAAVGAPPAATGPAKQPGPPIAPTPLAGMPRTPSAEQSAGRADSPAPPPVAPLATPTAASPGPAGAGAHVNGQMAGKLEQLGLTPAQVEAVLTLSREVVERVVWEVVPVLAETIIKEEIARLTK